MKLNVTWSEQTIYRADVEAPESWVPGVGLDSQAADASEELWTVLHECTVKTSVDAEDDVLVIEEVPE